MCDYGTGLQRLGPAQVTVGPFTFRTSSLPPEASRTSRSPPYYSFPWLFVEICLSRAPLLPMNIRLVQYIQRCLSGHLPRKGEQCLTPRERVS